MRPHTAEIERINGAVLCIVTCKECKTRSKALDGGCVNAYDRAYRRHVKHECPDDSADT